MVKRRRPFLANVAPGTSSRRDERLGTARAIVNRYIRALRNAGSRATVRMTHSADRKRFKVVIGRSAYSLNAIKAMTKILESAK